MAQIFSGRSDKPNQIPGITHLIGVDGLGTSFDKSDGRRKVFDKEECAVGELDRFANGDEVTHLAVTNGNIHFHGAVFSRCKAAVLLIKSDALIGLGTVYRQKQA